MPTWACQFMSPMTTKREPVELLQRVDATAQTTWSTPKTSRMRSMLRQPTSGPVVAVVGHQQRVEAELVLDDVGLEVAVLAAADRRSRSRGGCRPGSDTCSRMLAQQLAAAAPTPPSRSPPSPRAIWQPMQTPFVVELHRRGADRRIDAARAPRASRRLRRGFGRAAGSRRRARSQALRDARILAAAS